MWCRAHTLPRMRALAQHSPSYTMTLATHTVFAPTILPVATVELPPQNDELSNNTTLPSFSNSVLAADISAQPPPTKMAWSLFDPSTLPPSASMQADMYNNGRGKCKFVWCTSRMVLSIAPTTGPRAKNERSSVNEKIEAAGDTREDRSLFVCCFTEHDNFSGS